MYKGVREGTLRRPVAALISVWSVAVFGFGCSDATSGSKARVACAADGSCPAGMTCGADGICAAAGSKDAVIASDLGASAEVGPDDVNAPADLGPADTAADDVPGPDDGVSPGDVPDDAPDEGGLADLPAPDDGASPVCVANDTWCVGDVAKICSPDGFSIAEADCSLSGASCVGGQCIGGADIVGADGSADAGGDVGATVCVANDTWCVGDVAKACNGDGTAVKETDCAALGGACAAGGCTTGECALVRVLETRTNVPTKASVAVFFAVDSCEGEPIVGLGQGDFVVLEDDKPVSEAESQATIIAAKGTEVYLSLVLDSSPSVAASGSLDEAVTAAKALVDQVMGQTSGPGLRVSLSLFSKSLNTVVPFTTSKSEVLQALDVMAQGVPGASNTTNLYGALVDAIGASEAAQAARKQAMFGGVFTVGQIVVFTDGSDQAALVSQEAAQGAVDDTLDDVVTISLGGEVEPEVLAALGKNGYFAASDANALAGVFAAVSQRVADLQKRVYLLGYCSPKLAGTHSLTVDVLGGQGQSAPVPFNAALFGVLGGPECSSALFQSACDGFECGGLGCGGCAPDDVLCGVDGGLPGAPGLCLCTLDAECDDSVPCTMDTCQPQFGCYHTPDETLCDDGIDCTQDTCDAKQGCVWENLPDGFSCDDGDLCTQPDSCLGGVCATETTLCDDGNDCTQDSCNPGTGLCLHEPAVGACDDGQPCTLNDACVSGFCKGTAKLCAEIECHKSSCDVASGACVAEPLTDSWCDDEDLCTDVSTCQIGVCTGFPKSCDDKNPCTDDACAAQTGACVHVNNTAPCDDGLPCTLQDTCGDGSCNGAPKSCDDGSVCTYDQCNSGTGACINVTTLMCNDANLCTDDWCDPEQGCVSAPTSDPCDDSSPCTLNDTCTDGVCVGFDTCEDGDPCTLDQCYATGDCLHSPTSGACDDDDACTVGDACSPDGCMGAAKSCGDGDPCTVDACVAGECTHAGGGCCGGLGVECPAGFKCTDDTAAAWCASDATGEVFVPSGTFWMGCSGAGCDANEEPAHPVALSPFAIDENEVTAAQYKGCVDAGKCPAPGPANFPVDTFGKKPDHPINFVPFSGAVAYCAWAGGQLCTEAQWEMAARGSCAVHGCADDDAECCQPAMPLYSWGDALATCELAVFNETNTSQNGWGCGTKGTLPVGSRPANRSVYGALDLAGGVGEFVSDPYDANYYATFGEVVPLDPKGPASGDIAVVRGGGFTTVLPGQLESTHRGTLNKVSTGHLAMGLRCCRSLQ